MSRPEQVRQSSRTLSSLPEDDLTTWHPPSPSSQYRNISEQTQPHIRPGNDVTHEPKDSPDKLLMNFLRSNETYDVAQSGDPREARKTSQGLLKEILADRRWTRRMVEDFYNMINPSLGGLGTCLTPHPMHRTLYLVLLNALDDNEKRGTVDEHVDDDSADDGFVKADLAEFSDQGKPK